MGIIDPYFLSFSEGRWESRTQSLSVGGGFPLTTRECREQILERELTVLLVVRCQAASLEEENWARRLTGGANGYLRRYWQVQRGVDPTLNSL